jgi:hypothetical protein
MFVNKMSLCLVIQLSFSLEFAPRKILIKERNIREMILKKALELRRSIERYRRNMNELATNKGISNPDVIRMSQNLDEEIIILQKILYKKITQSRI